MTAFLCLVVAHLEWPLTVLLLTVETSVVLAGHPDQLSGPVPRLGSAGGPAGSSRSPRTRLGASPPRSRCRSTASAPRTRWLLALVFYRERRAQHARVTDEGDGLLWQWGLTPTPTLHHRPDPSARPRRRRADHAALPHASPTDGLRPAACSVAATPGASPPPRRRVRPGGPRLGRLPRDRRRVAGDLLSAPNDLANVEPHPRPRAARARRARARRSLSVPPRLDRMLARCSSWRPRRERAQRQQLRAMGSYAIR